MGKKILRKENNNFQFIRKHKMKSVDERIIIIILNEKKKKRKKEKKNNMIKRLNRDDAENQYFLVERSCRVKRETQNKI